MTPAISFPLVRFLRIAGLYPPSRTEAVINALENTTYHVWYVQQYEARSVDLSIGSVSRQAVQHAMWRLLRAGLCGARLVKPPRYLVTHGGSRKPFVNVTMPVSPAPTFCKNPLRSLDGDHVRIEFELATEIWSELRAAAKASRRRTRSRRLRRSWRRGSPRPGLESPPSP